MSNKQMYEDGFYDIFGSGASEYDRLKTLTEQMEWATRSMGIGRVQFEALPDPMSVEVIWNDPNNRIPKEVLLDTARNGKMLIHYVNSESGTDETACIGLSAMHSLVSNVTNTRGNGWNELPAENLAVALNAFIAIAGNLRGLYENGKMRAIVSPKFQEMPIPSLLTAVEALDAYMGTSCPTSGYVDHALTVVKYTFPDAAKAVTDAYRAVLALHGRTLAPSEQILPVAEFRSSNTTGDAAKLLTYLQFSDGSLMPVGEGVRVNHVAPVEYDEQGNRLTAMQKFQKEIQFVYSRMEFDLKTMLPKMLNTPIEYPGNTFIGLCKKAQIPHKWGGPAEEELRKEWPDHSSCTFLDIYEYLTSVVKYALRGTTNPNAARLLDLEESIARIASNEALWTQFDLPGTVAWVQAINKTN